MRDVAMRQETPINHEWLFYKTINGKAENITLPHTLSITPENSSGGRNLQCEVLYTRTLFLPNDKKENNVWLTLGAAMGVARVVLNGEHIHTSYCGYIPIVVDLSQHFNFGEDNILQVFLDNRDNEDVPPGKAQDDLDFTYDGGLYRTAFLTVVNSLHFTHELLSNTTAGGGIFVWSENVSEQSADVIVKVEIENGSNSTKEFELNCCLQTKQEDNATKDNTHYVLLPNTKGTYKFCFKIENPRLWCPETPNLYRVNCEIKQKNNTIDKIQTTFGIRSFKFTYENGIVWNGKSRRISGGNYHQTYPYIGNAVPENLLRRDAKKLRGLGMKNIRSHYPFADCFLNECDASGITLIVANPGWQWFKEGEFAQRLIDNMRNIIRWQRNHPCVILWEPMPNESIVPMEFQQKLHDAVHEEYPLDVCFTASDHGPTDVSYRQYDPAMLDPTMEGYNPTKRYGTKSDYPVWIREYNDAPDNWNDQGCAWRTPRQWGDAPMLRSVARMLGQDPQCKTNHYLGMLEMQNICGYGMWPAIEHNRGYHINPCWGGMLDLFRLRKFTADFMDCQQEPSEAGYKIFIANWFTDTSPDDVTVFSNGQSVQLYHNDVLIEERKAESIGVPYPPFVFKNVYSRFRGRDRSTLTAKAIVNEKVVASVSQKSSGTPSQLVLKVDYENIPVAIGEKDIVVVQCHVVDAEGTIVPWAASEHPICFSVTGNAKIVGDSTVGANPCYPKAGIACALIETNAKANDEIIVNAKMQWPQGNKRVAVNEASLVIKCSNNFNK